MGVQKLVVGNWPPVKYPQRVAEEVVKKQIMMMMMKKKKKMMMMMMTWPSMVWWVPSRQKMSVLMTLLNSIDRADICLRLLKERGFWTLVVYLLASESIDRKVVTIEHCPLPTRFSPYLPKTHPAIGSNAVAKESKHSNPVSKSVILHQRFQIGAVWRDDFFFDAVVSFGY